MNLERDLSNDGGIDKLLFSITEVATLEKELQMASDRVAAKQLEIVKKNGDLARLRGEFWAANSSRNAVFTPAGLLMAKNSEIFDGEYIEKFSEHLSESNDSLESWAFLAAMIAASIFLDDSDAAKKDEILHAFTGIFKEVTELNNQLENTEILEEISKSEFEQIKQQLEEMQSYRESVSGKLTDLREGEVFANRSRVLSFEPLLWGGV